MKLLFDQNLSPKLVALLAVEFEGSAHVRNLGMARAADPAVWAYAAANGFAIVSKDADFQQRALLMGPPPIGGLDSARELSDVQRGDVAPLTPRGPASVRGGPVGVVHRAGLTVGVP